MFATVWFGILEISTGRITAANAGHEYPVIKNQTTDSSFSRITSDLALLPYIFDTIYPLDKFFHSNHILLLILQQIRNYLSNILYNFISLLQDCVNNSHLWRNCGYTPTERYAKYAHNNQPMRVTLGKGGEKNFSGILTELQMQTYLIMSDFRQRARTIGLHVRRS